MKVKNQHTNQGSILKLLLVLTMMGVALVLSVGAMVYVSVRPSSDFRDLQEVVLDELPSRPNMRISIRAPSVLVSLARFGLSFIDDIDDEARLAIRAVRGGQVGVFQLPQPVSQADKVRILNRANETMKENGWNRIVAVVERDEMVSIYTPEGVDDPKRLEVLTIVLSNNELVMVSAKGDLRPIWDLAQTHMDDISDELRREFN